jgi:hypothetical protein
VDNKTPVLVLFDPEDQPANYFTITPDRGERTHMNWGDIKYFHRKYELKWAHKFFVFSKGGGFSDTLRRLEVGPFTGCVIQRKIGKRKEYVAYMWFSSAEDREAFQMVWALGR